MATHPFSKQVSRVRFPLSRSMVAQLGTTVKEMGLREFQRNMYTHIKEVMHMPLILTRNKQPFLVVISFKEWQRLQHDGLPQAGFGTMDEKYRITPSMPTLGDEGHRAIADRGQGTKPFIIQTTNIFQTIKRILNKKLA